MGDDQVMLGVYSTLHVVTDHPGSLAAGGHGSRVRIDQGYLLVRGGVNRLL